MEGIHDARRFMSALRAAAFAKPVVVMKAGRQPAGSTAALTHSAAIVAADDVFEAALRRAGAVRVRSFTQLFSAAKCLASRYKPVGKASGDRHQWRRAGGAGGRLGQRDRPGCGPAGRYRPHWRWRRRWRRTPRLESVIDLGEEAGAGAVQAPRCWPAPRTVRSTACW